MKPSTIALVVSIVLASIAFFALGWVASRRKYDKPVHGADTVYIEKWLPQPVEEPKDSTPLEPKIVYLPKPYPVHDTTEVHDTTTVRDSVLVEVPIIEKTYYGDNYRATIRGFEPELTDIWVKQKETAYRKRWSFTAGPQLGVGYTPKGLQPYAGAGITFGYSF